MKKLTLLIAALLAYTFAFGNDCNPNKHPSSAANIKFTILQDNGADAFEIVSFCEPANTGSGIDYIVDFLMLGKTDDGHKNLFIHEFVASSPTGALTDDGLWMIYDKALDSDDLSNMKAARKGSCKSPGDFTRSVSTGSSIESGKTNEEGDKSLMGGGVEIDLCGHGMDDKGNSRITYKVNGQ